MGNIKVAILGSYVTDLTGRGPSLPIPGQTVKGTSFKMGCGGKGFNQAVASHKYGIDTTIITKIGADVFGQQMLEFSKKEKMDTSHVFVDENIPTGAAVIVVDEISGQNQILVYAGACDHITDEDLEKSKPVIASSKVFLTQLETNLDIVYKAVDFASAKGIKVLLNPAPFQKVSDDLLGKIDVITPNETEASLLTGINVKTKEDAEKAAVILLEKGVKNVIVTLGSQGSYVRTADNSLYLEAHEVNAIDTTGAGDAFNGVFAARFAENDDIFEAARYANAAAALSVTRLGTAPAMPTREEIDAFVASRN